MLNFLKKWTNPGIFAPHVADMDSNKPSATLFFAYTSFFVAIGSVIYLCYKDPTEGALAAIAMSTVYIILYRLRKIDKFKFSKEGVEIDAEDEQDKNEA